MKDVYKKVPELENDEQYSSNVEVLSENTPPPGQQLCCSFPPSRDLTPTLTRCPSVCIILSVRVSVQWLVPALDMVNSAPKAKANSEWTFVPTDGDEGVFELHATAAIKKGASGGSALLHFFLSHAILPSRAGLLVSNSDGTISGGLLL